ncbi:MAG TPA: ornithine cyclodeaminase family protein [Gammaproteobacteria bacterium]|nr:ornithine cyclodeaminase family protein [Gammaproteobacteria bacterium]
MKIINLDQIKTLLNSINIIPAIEAGFVAFSNWQVVIPPVGELLFKDPPGDVHIKYGYIKQDDYYVIKVASGFYENPKLQLPSSNGLMLIFNQKTGELLSILLDEGYLTNIRTAAAGAIVAKHLAPKKVNKIGIIGTGTQARLQLDYLKKVISCKDVMIFGRDHIQTLEFQKYFLSNNFNIQIAQTIGELASSCNFIITATPSIQPLLFAEHIKPGTHITAIGADSPHKQELDEAVFGKADIIVADSISQCSERGDIAHALHNNIINPNQILELGNIISGKHKGRTTEDQITIADLTGLAVQDIQIAKAVYNAFISGDPK